MSIIYHLTTKLQWEEARARGHYETPSLADEGFIHCSEERQIPGVVERYFQGKSDLIKLVIDTERLASPLYYDWSPSIEDTFPHVYGPINLDAVISVEKV